MQLIGDKLSSVRGGRVVFADLSFSVAGGEALIVTGANGSGKTTLLRTIAGLLPAAEGQIRLEGVSGDRPVRERCHYVGHRNAIKAVLTVGENAAFWLRFFGGAMHRFEPALEAFGLSALRDIPAGYLSAGQQRRLGLARLLLSEQPVWLLDEPSASLDEPAQAMLAAAVNAHLAAGGLTVAATHAALGFRNMRSLELGRVPEAA